jgi:hypothetical protein
VHLTNAQYLALKNDINADGALAPKFAAGGADNFAAIAAAYNAKVPAFIVWKTAVDLMSIGNAVDATELVGLTTGKLTQLQCLLLFGDVNPSIANRRSAFDQIFNAASGTVTRPALLALWKRSALRIEKLFAVGTGTDADQP